MRLNAATDFKGIRLAEKYLGICSEISGDVANSEYSKVYQNVAFQPPMAMLVDKISIFLQWPLLLRMNAVDSSGTHQEINMVQVFGLVFSKGPIIHRGAPHSTFPPLRRREPAIETNWYPPLCLLPTNRSGFPSYFCFCCQQASFAPLTLLTTL